MKTIFCDIDGTLCVHHEDIIKQHRDELTLLPETLDVLRNGKEVVIVLYLLLEGRSLTVDNWKDS